MDARTAWYSVGASSTQLDTTSSSYSLLHSIYGSQVSQLPFSDYDSEASLNATQSEQYVPPHLSPNVKRRLSRPKSSPASVIAAREQLRSKPTPAPAPVRPPSRPGSALSRQLRPGSATRRIAHGRPASAAVGRPGSAATVVRGGASPNRRRPKTAMGFQRSPSFSGSSTFLLDLEEEDEREDVVAPIIRETPPVHLTHTPEYFDFWQGKPLRERDFGVKVHKRKPWKRPKSDYGNRFLSRSKENDEQGKNGSGGDGTGGFSGLETLLEKDSDSTLSSRRGSRDFGMLGDGDSGKGKDGGDSSKLGITGEGLGSRRGSKDFGGKGSLRDRSTSSTGSRGRKKGSGDSDKNLNKLGKGGLDSSGWGDQDGAATADDDDYFKNRALAATSWMDGGMGSGSGNTTRFELPMDMKTLEGMTPLEYLNTHCVISKRRMAHCSKVFSKLDPKKTLKLNSKEIKDGLVQAHHNCITEEQASSVLDLVELGDAETVNVKLFAAICCFAERMLNLFFLPLARKEVIETVDFEALDWKLRDCTIKNSLRMLFSQL